MKLTEIHDSRPMVVTMLSRLLRHHFKEGGPELRLKDDEWDINAPINGYELTPAGELQVAIYRPNGQQTITYTNNLVAADKLTIKKGTHDDQPVWYLVYSSSA